MDLRLDLASSLRASDNHRNERDPEGNAGVLRTDLDFGLHSQTRTQELSLGLGLRHEVGAFAGQSGPQGRIEGQRMDLAYTLESRATALGMRAGYEQRRVNDGTLGDGFDQRDIRSSRGDLITHTLGINAQSGREAPIGLTFAADLRTRTYRNVETPDLFDSDTQRLELGADLDLSQLLQLSPYVGASHYSAENAARTKRDRHEWGLRAQYQIAPDLRFSTGLTHTRVKTRETLAGPRGSDTVSGGSGSLSLRRDLRNGMIEARYDSRLSAAGRRQTLMVERGLDTGLGALAVSLGLTDAQDSAMRGLINIDYSHALPAGRLSARLSQSARTDISDDGTLLRSRLSLRYEQEINAVSNLSARLDLGQLDALSTGGEDAQSARFNLTYRRALDRDWDMTGGIEHSYSKTDTNRNRSASTLFMGLERRFNLRP